MQLTERIAEKSSTAKRSGIKRNTATHIAIKLSTVQRRDTHRSAAKNRKNTQPSLTQSTGRNTIQRSTAMNSVTDSSSELRSTAQLRKTEHRVAKLSAEQHHAA